MKVNNYFLAKKISRLQILISVILIISVLFRIIETIFSSISYAIPWAWIQSQGLWRDIGHCIRLLTMVIDMALSNTIILVMIILQLSYTPIRDIFYNH